MVVRRTGGRPGKRKRGNRTVERGLWESGLRLLAGLDEVGRGPLAGPVVAAAVVLPPECFIRGVTDSKLLTPDVRLKLCGKIMRKAVAYGLGAASPREIDELNIRRATALAMERALRRLRIAPEHLLVDGLPVPELGLERQTAVVDGDRLIHCVACASIIAKVCRDGLMDRLCPRYPVYGWSRNKGYATDEHRVAIMEYGPTPHHRRTFSSVDQLALEL